MIVLLLISQYTWNSANFPIVHFDQTSRKQGLFNPFYMPLWALSQMGFSPDEYYSSQYGIVLGDGSVVNITYFKKEIPTSSYYSPAFSAWYRDFLPQAANQIKDYMRTNMGGQDMVVLYEYTPPREAQTEFYLTRVRLAVCLFGFDIFSRLRPGPYTLKFRCAYKDPITIDFPIYQTFYFPASTKAGYFMLRAYADTTKGGNGYNVIYQYRDKMTCPGSPIPPTAHLVNLYYGSLHSNALINISLYKLFSWECYSGQHYNTFNTNSTLYMPLLNSYGTPLIPQAGTLPPNYYCNTDPNCEDTQRSLFLFVGRPDNGVPPPSSIPDNDPFTIGFRVPDSYLGYRDYSGAIPVVARSGNTDPATDVFGLDRLTVYGRFRPITGKVKFLAVSIYDGYYATIYNNGSTSDSAWFWTYRNMEHCHTGDTDYWAERCPSLITPNYVLRMQNIRKITPQSLGEYYGDTTRTYRRLYWLQNGQKAIFKNGSLYDGYATTFVQISNSLILAFPLDFGIVNEANLLDYLYYIGDSSNAEYLANYQAMLDTLPLKHIYLDRPHDWRGQNGGWWHNSSLGCIQISSSAQNGVLFPTSACLRPGDIIFMFRDGKFYYVEGIEVAGLLVAKGWRPFYAVELTVRELPLTAVPGFGTGGGGGSWWAPEVQPSGDFTEDVAPSEQGSWLQRALNALWAPIGQTFEDIAENLEQQARYSWEQLRALWSNPVKWLWGDNAFRGRYDRRILSQKISTRYVLEFGLSGIPTGTTKKYEWLKITAPSFNMGLSCAGFLYNFSWDIGISMEEISAYIKNATSSAVGAFLTIVWQSLPYVGKIQEQLNKLWAVRKSLQSVGCDKIVNFFNQAGQELTAAQKTCVTMWVAYGIKDFNDAVQRCTQGEVPNSSASASSSEIGGFYTDSTISMATSCQAFLKDTVLAGVMQVIKPFLSRNFTIRYGSFNNTGIARWRVKNAQTQNPIEFYKVYCEKIDTSVSLLIDLAEAKLGNPQAIYEAIMNDSTGKYREAYVALLDLTTGKEFGGGIKTLSMIGKRLATTTDPEIKAIRKIAFKRVLRAVACSRHFENMSDYVESLIMHCSSVTTLASGADSLRHNVNIEGTKLKDNFIKQLNHLVKIFEGLSIKSIKDMETNDKLINKFMRETREMVENPSKYLR